MRLIAVPTLVILICLSACAFQDRSLLTKAGDELLDCDALQAEMDFAANLGEDAPARRRHIKALQEKKQCISKPKVSVSFGFSKTF
jgi:hypothetical protein